MKQLFRIIFDIMRLRAGPQDLPADWRWLYVLIPLDVLVSTVAHMRPIGQTLIAMAVFLAMTGATVQLVLQLGRKPARFPQTFMAVIGIDTVITLLSLPLALAAPSAEAVQGGAQVSPLMVLAFYGLLGWNVIALGHVFRHALNLSLALGTAVGLSVFLLPLFFMP